MSAGQEGDVDKRQLLGLCACNAVAFIGVSALFNLMPLYLPRIGGNAASTGLVLAVAYLSLALSALAAGQLAARFQRRTFWLRLGGLAAAPLAWGLRGASTVVALALLLACLWFATGLVAAMVGLLTARSATPGQRGRGFGLVGLSAGVGLFLGSLAGGRIVERWGFGALFAALGGGYLLIPLVGLLVREGRAGARDEGRAVSARVVVANRTFLALFIASIVGQAANIVLNLARPLLMAGLRFEPTAITTAAAVGSLVTLPLPLVVGRLSDRLGRKPLLLLCFLGPPTGLLVLTVAQRAPHFWAASILGSVLGLSGVVASALAADLFPAGALDTALSLLGATTWVGVVIGLSVGGAAIEALGIRPVLLLGVLGSLLALGLVALIADPRPGESRRAP